MIQIKFKSKSKTLKILQNNLKKSSILPLYDFLVEDWNENHVKILDTIQKKFSSKIIIRSSALGEDSINSSKAGKFLSIPNVEISNRNQIYHAINQVINSYVTNDDYNPKNQVLIQKQAENIISSGVVFSRTLEGFPYYLLNYEDGGSTDGVTQGKINNTLKIFRKINYNKLSKKWKNLIIAINEIEHFFKNTSLDIEFAITKKNKIIIFQVRPIVNLKQKYSSMTEIKIKNYIKSINEDFFSKSSDMNNNNKIILSDMSDWNPAEIIGNQSNILDYSLYDYLIMNSVWHIGRTNIGYFDVKSFPLMKRIGLKSFVDVNGSFNSLTPKNINTRTRKKLINFYSKKLKKFPFLHDKIEFDLIFSCFDLTTEEKLLELKKYNFSNYEINYIKSTLLDFTNNIIEKFPSIVIQTKNSMINLDEKYIKTIKILEESEKTYKDYLFAADKLLKDCKNFGTIPFSTMARIAFIANSILKSLSIKKILNDDDITALMNSMTTPLTRLQNDLNLLHEKRISKRLFLKKYGHLRPGTYDITALRYDQLDHFKDGFNLINKKPKFLSKFKNLQVEKSLLENLLTFNTTKFSDFVLESSSLREELKFNFTKNLSYVLECITLAGRELGFSRNDLSDLDIETILDFKQISKKKLISKWKNKIKNEKNNKLIFSSLVLPSLIFKKEDLEIIDYFDSKPNYISKKIVKGNLSYISKINEPSLAGKIILLENADPGYDWIFTHNPLALITKYGGVASHMAIRCAEINLPAAIGCGELLFQKLLNSKKISLDCKNEQIIILESSIVDEELELKKTLKSLGYIK